MPRITVEIKIIEKKQAKVEKEVITISESHHVASLGNHIWELINAIEQSGSIKITRTMNPTTNN